MASTVGLDASWIALLGVVLEIVRPSLSLLVPPPPGSALVAARAAFAS